MHLSRHSRHSDSLRGPRQVSGNASVFLGPCAHLAAWKLWRASGEPGPDACGLADVAAASDVRVLRLSPAIRAVFDECTLTYGVRSTRAARLRRALQTPAEGETKILGVKLTKRTRFTTSWENGGFVSILPGRKKMDFSPFIWELILSASRWCSVHSASSVRAFIQCWPLGRVRSSWPLECGGGTSRVFDWPFDCGAQTSVPIVENRSLDFSQSFYTMNRNQELLEIPDAP